MALLGVLFFHAHGALRGGYLGVDLFFVLSGFLITSLLLAEHEASGRIDLAGFWVRRARRLFPALLSLMPAIAVYCWVIARPDELRGLRVEALATLGYVANWQAIFAHKSYWELFTAPSPLEHTWSLAIEEQFYVVWPLVVSLVLARGTLRTLLTVCLVVGAASMVEMYVLSNAETTARAYMGTDTRATSILSGAALATLMSLRHVRSAALTQGKTRVLGALGIVAACGLAIAWWRLDGTSAFLYRGGFWLTEACALVLISCAVAAPRSLVSRAMSLGPLRYLGTISYGAYLWHWPVDVVLTAERIHVHGFRLYAIQLTLTLAIAIVSYRFLERPIRQRGVPFGRPMIVVPAVIALAVVLVVRATYARKPAPGANPGASLPDLPPIPAAGDGVVAREWGGSFRILVLGDSTANSLGWGLRGLREPGVVVDLRGKDSCTMLWDTCGGETWRSLEDETKPNVTLVFLGGAFLHGIDAEGRWRQACHRRWDEKFLTTLTTRLTGLATPETRVWLVTVPYPLGPYDSAPWRELVDCINASIRKAAADVPDVHILDLATRLCPNGECEREYEGITIRPDGVHYDISGAVPVSRWALGEIMLRARP